MSSSEDIYVLTNQTLKQWIDGAVGWAPPVVSELLQNAQFIRMIELTKCLQIWEEKIETMTEGELILAYTNLGSLLESWLIFFFVIYYEDYIKDSGIKKNKSLEKQDLSILIKYSQDRLWSAESYYVKWSTRIRSRRNSIHHFASRDIGTPEEYMVDLKIMHEFIGMVSDRLPDPPSRYFFGG